MSFFEGSIVQSTSVTSTAAVIWNPTNSSTTTFGPLGAAPTGAALNHVGIVYAGTVAIYVGGTAVTTYSGLPIPPGGQLGIQRYSFTAGAAATSSGTISAVTASGTAQVQVGLISITAVN